MNTTQQSIESSIPDAFQSLSKIEILLDAVRQAAVDADQDCGNVERTSHWLALIEASVGHAQTMLHEMLDEAYAEIGQRNSAQRQTSN